MLQAIIKKGIVIGEEVSAPLVSEGSLLIKTVNSCISAGTEMSSVNTSGMSIIKRALKQPENVIKVLESIRNKGFVKAYNKVKGELDGGKPTGYSLSGIIIGIGSGVKGFEIGDHVTASGAGLANHAEYVDVPINLVTKIPQDMCFKEASTVTLGAIALQGIRRADLRMGELAVVVGTGVLGLLTVQMLKNSGVRVAAVDLDKSRLSIARELGAEIVLNPVELDVTKEVENWSGGFGADAVLFTAATSSSEPLSTSFQMCRKKGRVILVGVVGMKINRADIYKKEIDFLISTSYGPGRYDSNYEKKGFDYPYAYVRWTENRNMSEYLRLVYSKKIKLDKLINENYPINNVTEAYNCLKNNEKKPLIVLLDYGMPSIEDFNSYFFLDRKIVFNNNIVKKDVINFALVGAGGFATNMHLPNLSKMKDKYQLHAIVDSSGSKAKNVAQQFGAKYSTTDINEVLNDKDVDMVMITTRHNTHAELVLKALKAGKHVFVEKPLATSQDELDKLKAFYDDKTDNKPVLMVGFNRRFSKFAYEIKKHTNKRVNPLFIRYRMNAGFIPADHWVHDNGGRIIGEGCHIIDLMTYFTDSQIKSINFESLSPKTEKFLCSDNKSIILKYKDGSLCVIDYFSTGNKKFIKEFMEVHFDEKTIVLDDYKIINGFGIKLNSLKTNSSQKGQYEELVRFHKTLIGKTREWPIELWDMVQTSEATFKIVDQG